MKKVNTVAKWEKHPSLIQAFTTKKLGNLSFRIDDPHAVIERRKALAQELDISMDDFLFIPVSHSNTVLSLPKESILQKDEKNVYLSGGHIQKKSSKTIYENPDCQSGIDAIVTDKENVFPVILSADCAAIGFFCPAKSVVALCHAGLIGAINQIPALTLQCMIEEYECPVSEIEAIIFPSIRKCHYDLKASGAWQEIKDFVLSRYGNSPDFIQNNMIDLQSLILDQIKSAGIPEKNIFDTNLCTICNREWFFSNYAAKNPEDKKKEGRFATIIGIKKK